jgi:hypothetical protein
VRNWCGDFGRLREMDTTVFALAIHSPIWSS